MYRILSIEDSPEEEAQLRAHVERYAKETDIELSLSWERSAFDLVDIASGYDLVFLDIDLPGINGMDAAMTLRESNPDTPLIFVTNLSQYAVHGYDVDALSFMVKPVAYPDFRMRMDKALRVIGRKATERISITVGGGMRFVEISDIAFVEVTNHDLTFHLANGEKLISRGQLAKLEEQLSGASFVRVSKSSIANLAHIRKVRGNDLVMSNGEVISFSRSRRKPALETIAHYLGGSI